MLFMARNNVPAMTDGSPTGSFFAVDTLALSCAALYLKFARFDRLI